MYLKGIEKESSKFLLFFLICSPISNKSLEFLDKIFAKPEIDEILLYT